MVKKQDTTEDYKTLIDRWLELEQEDKLNGTHQNRHKMYRLALKMKDQAKKFEDWLEVACILGQGSRYFPDVFVQLRSSAANFEQSETILDCCCEESDGYYPLILKDLRNKAVSLGDWYSVYDNTECLLDYLYDTDDGSIGNASAIETYQKRLEDAYQHILDLSQTVEDLDNDIFFFTNGSKAVEEIIKRRDTLLLSK